MEMASLSKSRFTACANCRRALWLACNRPELESHEDSSRAEAGREIGDLARAYFGDYELVEHDPTDYAGMVARTAELMADPSVENIAEATFSRDGLFCMVDILHRNGRGWDLVEVKSTTQVKPRHVLDVAFQHLAVTHAGAEIGRDYVMHLDNGYVREGELDLKGLFALEDVTEQVGNVLAGDESVDTPHGKRLFEHLLAEARNVAAPGAEDPESPIGPWCISPHECGFKGFCWEKVPEGTPLEFAGMQARKKFRLYASNPTMADMLADRKEFSRLNERQKSQVLAYTEKTPELKTDPEGLAKWLECVRYPLHYLDFETVQPVVPAFDGTKPYTQVPTQYSLHIQREPGGRCEHREFLATEGSDPRRALAERLCADIPEGACSIAWNMSFERGVIKGLAGRFPDLAEHLMSIHDNMVDQMVPFKDGAWCSPAQHGSYSIKKVLPAMFPDDPELDYRRLEGIHNGVEAMDAYLCLALKPAAEVAVIREQLLKYCELDTWAMVRIQAEIERLAKEAQL